MIMVYRNLLLVSCLALIFCVSCGRKTSGEKEPGEEQEITAPVIKDATSITPEDPFRNQPNDLCTIIRKLDISYYSPQTVTDDPSSFPEKYCLLDICLETIDPNGTTINIGED